VGTKASRQSRRAKADRLAIALLAASALLSSACSELLSLDETRHLRPSVPEAGAGGTAGGSGGGSAGGSGGGTAGGSGGGTAGGSGGGSAGGSGGGSAGGSGGGGAGPLAYADRVLADGPVAYFRFEDMAPGPLANAANGALSAAVEGTASFRQPGAVDFALGLDGSSARAVVGDHYDFAGNVPMSIEIWVHAENLTTFQYIVQKRTEDGSGVQGYSLSIDHDGLLNFTRARDGAYRHAKASMIGTGFVHVVGTFDGTSSTLYLQGVQADSNAIAGDLALADTTADLMIGSASDFGYLSGTIDELALYDKALSEQTVLEHYEAAP
jgi:hypothetical protein